MVGIARLAGELELDEPVCGVCHIRGGLPGGDRGAFLGVFRVQGVRSLVGYTITMLSEIKSITSPDVVDFNTFWPEDEETFSFLLSVRVGPRGEAVDESFDIRVCTPKWLLANYKDTDMILGSYKLIVFKYDIDAIFKRINRIFANCSGKDWNEIALKLSRVGHWEFENYQDYKG